MNKNYHNLPVVALVFLLLASLIGGFSIFELKKLDREISQTFLSQLSAPLEKQTEPATVIFVGDIMLDRGVEWSINKYGSKDWKFPFLKITKDLEKADILFGNLESVISDKGTNVGSIYSFRADPEAIEGLTFAGFDIVSVANNHIFDYSSAAMEDSFKRLKEAGIDYVGGGFNEEEAHSPVIREIKNPSAGSGQVKIAFLAYTDLNSEYWIADEKHSGITRMTKERLEKDIKEVKKQADVVVVSMHFGNEYQTESNDFQKSLARAAIDTGADLIVGHHPHVIQEIEEYKGKYIAYSLGNFIFDQAFSEETMQGLMFKVIIKNGKIKEVVPVNIKLNQYFQPEIVE